MCTKVNVIEVVQFLERMWEYHRKRGEIQYVCTQSKENEHLKSEEQYKLYLSKIEELDKEYLAPFDLEFKNREFYYKGTLLKSIDVMSEYKQKTN